jgi:F-type H+-transporting ATPase subunit a
VEADAVARDDVRYREGETVILFHALIAASKPFEVPPAGKLFNYEPLFKVGSIVVTYPTVIMFAITLVLGIFFWRAFAKPRLVPAGAQNVGEMGIDFVSNQIVNPVLGPQGAVWLPFLTTVFFWVLLNNAMGLVPGVQLPITSTMAYPALLAILAWFIYNAIGIKNQGPIGYFKNMMFPPGVPWWVYILLAPIEFISNIIVRPLTLAVRLFANMVAGHMILTVLFLGTSVFLAGNVIGKVGVIAPLGLGIIMTFFELFVLGMQAFIITILIAVYIAGAQEAHH